MSPLENELLTKGVLVYKNKGDSMMPLLRENRDLLVIRTLTEPPKKYDAVLFKRPSTGTFVLHRIVKVCRDGSYRIVGDNRAVSERVPREWIIGILTEVIRDGEHLKPEGERYRRYLKQVARRRRKLLLLHYRDALLSRGKRLIRKIWPGASA